MTGAGHSALRRARHRFTEASSSRDPHASGMSRGAEPDFREVEFQGGRGPEGLRF